MRESGRLPNVGIVIALAVFMLVIWLALPLATIALIGKPKSAAEVGEAFNLANSLFSGCAIIGVVYTINLQSRESEDRFRQAKEQKARETKELQQALYTLRLQFTRTSIEEHRQAIPELLPFIAKLPVSEEKLVDLRKRISREITQTRENTHLVEAQQRLDELMLLQKQIVQVRLELEQLNVQSS